MVLARGYINREQLEAAVERAKQKLGPEIVRLTHSLGEDSTGEPAIYFWIVLTDAASQMKTLAEITGPIKKFLFAELRPYEDWDLRMYFSFRSQSEQLTRNDAAWA